MISKEIAIKEQDLKGKSQGSYHTEILMLMFEAKLASLNEKSNNKGGGNHKEDTNSLAFKKYVEPLIMCNYDTFRLNQVRELF